MHKVSRASVYGLVGLTAFGVAYDSGLFGPPDGHDHSALIAIFITPSTGTAISNYSVVDNVTGNSVAIHQPETIRLQTGE
jgi:hypothetical protein